MDDHTNKQPKQLARARRTLGNLGGATDDELQDAQAVFGLAAFLCREEALRRVARRQELALAKKAADDRRP